ncbi:unnamed protein product [Acanthoscelides obtectus]|uniref:Uncharacterized protein n=1 Tax=Acanthoscelides obtectus TaxID=200917 RepID=A0A9P0PMX8_ACAOB|nr:unnamed protein product [Acanthoscelides obtectus]CAK1624591.1 hypothetical protein AOBTE_LOCUS2629 [Acanthoscelides obtectus]
MGKKYHKRKKKASSSDSESESKDSAALILNYKNLIQKSVTQDLDLHYIIVNNAIAALYLDRRADGRVVVGHLRLWFLLTGNRHLSAGDWISQLIVLVAMLAARMTSGKSRRCCHVPRVVPHPRKFPECFDNVCTVVLENSKDLCRVHARLNVTEFKDQLFLHQCPPHVTPPEGN